MPSPATEHLLAVIVPDRVDVAAINKRGDLVETDVEKPERPAEVAAGDVAVDRCRGEQRVRSQPCTDRISYGGEVRIEDCGIVEQGERAVEIVKHLRVLIEGEGEGRGPQAVDNPDRT